MKMDYKITTAGTTPGGSRTAFAKTLSAAAPTSADFGLKSEPEKIWKLMVQGNTGIFSKAGGALKKFASRVVQKTAPYEQMALIINEDGFGLKKP